MQDSLKYLCAQFGYDWTKHKKMVKDPMDNYPRPTFEPV